MVRYKRYRKRRYGASTRIIKMKFQSFMDISTSASSMQIITVSAGGRDLLRRLGPQFGAYKYYKIGNIAVKLVPASTLPVDPTGLSYEAGESTVDPRDQLTPGMMRITNGEDVFEDLTGLTDSQMHGIYNNMLLDPRWFKWMLQSGVKRHATPRYWQIGQLHQDKWPGAVINYPAVESGAGTDLEGTIADMKSVKSGVGLTDSFIAGSSRYGFFQTGHRGVLGWLPTDSLSVYADGTGSAQHTPLLSSPPEVEVMKIILPKAYKTVYYYRMFITESVYFKEPIVNLGIIADDAGSTYRPIDVFHINRASYPLPPSQAYIDPNPTNSETGGNYGDN